MGERERQEEGDEVGRGEGEERESSAGKKTSGRWCGKVEGLSGGVRKCVSAGCEWRGGVDGVESAFKQARRHESKARQLP